MAPGTPINVPASSTGLNASGTGGEIVADGTTLSLEGNAATGALAQQGAAISLSGASLATVSTATAAQATAQRGMRAIGPNSTISAIGADITLRPNPALITAAATNMIGVEAEQGGTVRLSDTDVIVTSATNGFGNYGLRSTGDGSLIEFSGGSVVTRSRGAFGALAEAGGRITFTEGASISAEGLATSGTGIPAHALIATGTGSEISGNGISANTSSNNASAAVAELGALMTISGSALSTTGIGAKADHSAAVLATSGSTVRVDAASTITTTGRYADGVSAKGARSQAFLTDSTAVTSGTSPSAAAAASQGGAITVDNSVLRANGTAGIGALIEGAGSSLTMTNTTVDIQGNGPAYGVRILAGAQGSMTGGTITTVPIESAAVFVGQAELTLTDVVINTSGGGNAMGAIADLGSRVSLLRGSITTSGDPTRVSTFAHAMMSRNPGALLIADGVTAVTTGDKASGANADDGGSIQLMGGSIRTEGAQAWGVFSVAEQPGVDRPASIIVQSTPIETIGAFAHGTTAQARNDLDVETATVEVRNLAITTHGDAADGLRAVLADYGNGPQAARGEANVVATDSDVITHGAAAHGALSWDSPTSVTMVRSSVLTHGERAHGAAAHLGGRLIGTEATVEATGASSMGLFVTGEPGVVSNATFATSDILNSSGPTVGIAGHGDVSLTDSRAGGSGHWLHVGTIDQFPEGAPPEVPLTGVQDEVGQDPEVPLPEAPPPPAAIPGAPSVVVQGLGNIALTRSTVTGSASTAAGSISNVTMVDATWNLTGSSNVTNLVNDPSLIDFSAPVNGAFKTLTVVNYSGDGTIALNTFLGDDNSPSDRLVVDGGTATGPSLLQIKPAGGAGALTVANGILVVDATNDATSATNAFLLAGRVAAGPYEYTLHRSSVDPSAPESWFLRSTIDCSASDAPVPPCPAPPPPDPDPDPTPDPTPDPDPAPDPPLPPVPNFRPEVSLYAALAPTALQYGRSLLDTLHERVGEQELLWNRRDLDDDRNVHDGMWGRLMYVNGERDSEQGVYGEGPAYDYVFAAVQLGYDLYRHEEPDEHRDHAGIYGAAGYAETEVDHWDGTRAGDTRIDGYTLGGYWTRYGQKQWYIDTVLQATWYDASANPALAQGVGRLTTDGWGMTASVEAGYPFRNERDWVLEPQAQVIYSWLDLDDSSDLAADVRFDDSDSLVGRLSARLSRDWIHQEDPDSPLYTTGWGRLGVWHEFRGEPDTVFSSEAGYLPFHADMSGTWWEAELGGTRELDRNVFLFGNVGYSQGFDDDRRAWEGKLGLRANW